MGFKALLAVGGLKASPAPGEFHHTMRRVDVAAMADTLRTELCGEKLRPQRFS